MKITRAAELLTPGDLRSLLDSGFATGKNLTVTAVTSAGETIHFPATLRIDTP